MKAKSKVSQRGSFVRFFVGLLLMVGGIMLKLAIINGLTKISIWLAPVLVVCGFLLMVYAVVSSSSR